MAGQGLDERLEALQDAILRFGEDVIIRLRDAITALERRDVALAAEVIEGDDEINERYFELEGECIDLLALQHPVAGDLRFVVASFKILTDLERVGDLAVNLGELVRAIESDSGPVGLPDLDVTGAASFAADMVDDALMAYATGDPEACRDLVDRDDVLDRRCDEATAALIRTLVEQVTVHTDQQPLLDAVRHVLLIIRDIERVGDHAANIAGRTFYMATADPTLIYSATPH